MNHASDKKVAIVTGSARESRSTAVMLAERNYNVVVNYASSAGGRKRPRKFVSARGRGPVGSG